MTNEKDFLKTISQSKFDYGLFTSLPRMIVSCYFSPRSFKVKVHCLPRKTKCLKLKTTYHIKPILSLWTKLSKNLLLVKYHISVAAALILVKFIWLKNIFVTHLRIHWRLIFGKITHCSTLRLWVDYFFYFKLTPVFF